MNTIDYSHFPKHHVLCIDIRSFYASVEAVKLGLNPLTTKLAVVGDLNRKGSIVLASSPILKKVYGLSNVNRYFEIPNDPSIHIVQANMADYVQTSIQITKLLHRYAPQEAIHPYSVDEMWLTVDGIEKLSGYPLNIAQKIKADIYNSFGLTSAIGIGDNKFLAKVVLDLHAKKEENNIATCTYEDVKEKLWPFPVEKIWGIGNRLKHRLNNLGIMTLGQLAQFPLEQLKSHFGVMGEQLYWHAWGVDLSPVIGNFTKTDRDSYGHGISLLRNYSEEETLICILELCEEVCHRAREDNKAGRTIHLGIRYCHKAGGGFNRSTSISIPTNITMDMYRVCLQLFNMYYDGKSDVRRVYVTLTNLIDDGVTQLDFFNERPKQKDIGYVMDAIRNKYGIRSILRASSYTDAGITLERSKKIGGHWA